MLWDEPKIFFLERRYFFSIILSEFLKNRVALHPRLFSIYYIWGILSYFGIFLGLYFICWGLDYSMGKREVKQWNEKINE